MDRQPSASCGSEFSPFLCLPSPLAVHSFLLKVWGGYWCFNLISPLPCLRMALSRESGSISGNIPIPKPSFHIRLIPCPGYVSGVFGLHSLPQLGRTRWRFTILLVPITAALLILSMRSSGFCKPSTVLSRGGSVASTSPVTPITIGKK